MVGCYGMGLGLRSGIIVWRQINIGDILESEPM